MPPETELGQDGAHLAGLLRDLAHWLDDAKGDAGWLAALRFGVAGGLSSLGEAGLAEAGFRKILAQNPDHLWSWIGLIDIALSRGDASAAAAIGRAGLARMPGDALLRRKTAEAVEQAEGPDAALAVMGAGGDLSPDDLAFAIGLHRAAGCVARAVDLCDRLLAVRPDDRLAHLARIEIGLQAGDGAGAIRAAAAALTHHPTHPETLLRAAQAHHAAGDRAGVAAILGRVPEGADFAAEFQRLRGGPDRGLGAGDLPVAPPPARALALFDDLENALAQDGAGVEPALRRVLACADLPWYLAIRLVERVWAAGADTLAARLSVGFDTAPWPAADRAAFAVEDALLRHGPRAALDWLRANPVARRDHEAAERLARVLVAAGGGALAARYARACCRRWHGDAAFAGHVREAMIACGASGDVTALTGEHPVPVANQIEVHLLAGDLPAAEACLSQVKAADGPMQEALICRPRATRVGSLLNEARILSAAGVDWARGDAADLMPVAKDFFLPARTLVARMSAQAVEQGTGAAVPDLLHLFWRGPAPPPDDAGRMFAALRGASRRSLVLQDVKTAPGWLRDNIGADAARAYALAPDPDQRADLMLLAALLVEGGVGLGAPQWPGGGLDALLETPGGATVFLDDGGAVSTAAVIAPPGHPVIGAGFDMAVAACLSRENDHRWFKTGPGLLTRALALGLGQRGAVTLRPLARLRRVLHPYRPVALPDARGRHTPLVAAFTAVLADEKPGGSA